MTPEEWLRERGIEVERQRPAAQRGQFAGQHTGALPNVPHLSAPPLDEVETQLVPSVVRLDLHIRGDVAEWPTAALPNSIVPLDESSEWAYIRSDADYSLEEEMTMPLPIITLPPKAPKPASLDEEAIDAITNTPTKRLEG